MATYYVDPVNGSDSNAGTSFALAWKSTVKAAATVAAGDQVRLCQTGTESITGGTPITVATAGTNTVSGQIKWIAYDSTGTNPLPNGSYYVVDGSGMTAGTDLVLFNAPSYNRFQGVRFTGARRNALAKGVVADPSIFLQFVNCKIDAAVTACVGNPSDTNGFSPLMTGCVFVGGANCFVPAASNRGTPVCRQCEFTSFSGTIISSNAAAFNLIGCRFYGNSGTCLNISSGTVASDIDTCVFYNNGIAVLLGTNTTANLVAIIRNTIFMNNTTAVSTFSSTANINALFMDYNLFYGNTTTNGGGVTLGPHDLTGSDPLFNAAGSADFRLKSGSPAIGAGIDGVNIGGVAQMASAAFTIRRGLQTGCTLGA